MSQIFRKNRDCYGDGIAILPKHGVAVIYLLNNIKARRSFDLELYKDGDRKPDTSNFFLCCVYRPPTTDTTFWKNFSWSLEKSNELSDRIIILGDLNVDFLNIPPSHIIHDILQHNNLTNTIHEPTRITHSTQTILTSHDLTIAETGTLQMDARLSDHKATYISLKVDYDTRHAYKRKIWQYKDADTDKLNYLIETFDWKHLLENTNSVEIASDKFSTEYLKLVRECIPEKTITIRPKDKPWFDSVLRKFIRKRNRLRRKALRSKRHNDWHIKYKHIRNKVNNMKSCVAKLLRKHRPLHTL